jgi:hypothetical protein
MKCSTGIRQQQVLQTPFSGNFAWSPSWLEQFATDVQYPQRYSKDLDMYHLNQLKYPLDVREYIAHYPIPNEP